MIKDERQVGEGDKVVETPDVLELIAVENWFEELKRLAPTGR
jgi:hypothetical protein